LVLLGDIFFSLFFSESPSPDRSLGCLVPVNCSG